ncbi:unnamed protein product [Thelazia callipaeda]|uniref:Usp domain-containing protein n=1 Tax=Thelazia callipaeda TaxID=103827 RepID=A0A0N5DCC3_THECL|nr:unnamed protein product [Thelazia callipaeda]
MPPICFALQRDKTKDVFGIKPITLCLLGKKSSTGVMDTAMDCLMKKGPVYVFVFVKHFSDQF